MIVDIINKLEKKKIIMAENQINSMEERLKIKEVEGKDTEIEAIRKNVIDIEVKDVLT